MGAKYRICTSTGGARPLLLVDIDGVISLIGPPHAAVAAPGGSATGPAVQETMAIAVEGAFHSIEGIPHFLSSTAAAHLLALTELFEPVWASGWEEKANEHLPHLLGLPSALPFIRFSDAENANRTPHAHWKLGSIAAYAGERPLAWVDDAFNPACHEWAQARTAPTLLVGTAPERGLTDAEARMLREWAVALTPGV